MLLKHKILTGVGLACALGLAALSQYRGSHASVSLHGVNYSDREFSYLVEDPEDPTQPLGGEHIAPFAGGGTTCCALLPWKWKPGTKVRLTTFHWLKQRPDGSLPRVMEEHEIEVPEYAEVGELWVIRDVNGKISVVSSNFQPDHANWPGKIKGWPVPTLEYQRERWELYIHEKKVYLNTYTALLKKLENDPEKQAAEAWNHAKEYSPSELRKFSGPTDPNYISYLKSNYSNGLKETTTELNELLRSKP